MSSLKRKSADTGVLMTTLPKIKKKNDELFDNDGAATITDGEARLNEDALCLVMQFLGPRELYRLAFSSKSMMSRVTTSLVMRSVIVNYNGKGKHAKNSLSTIKDLVEKRAIHLPSPLRLLRLVNGLRCEFCNLKRVNTVRDYYGCFLCPSCVENNVEDLSHKERRLLPDCLKKYPGSNVMGCCPWKGTCHAGGEPIGPVVLYRHVRNTTGITKITRSVSLPRPYDDASLAESRVAFLEDYKQAMYGERRMKMLLRVQALQNAVSLKEKRTVQLAKFIEQVRANLDERWRDFALVLDDRPWRITTLHDNFYASQFTDLNYGGIYSGVPFRCPIVQARLQRFVKTPSKARKKFAMEAAQDINQVYGEILSSGLLSFAFLKDRLGLNDDDKARLYQHARANYPSLQAFVHAPMFNYHEPYIEDQVKADREFLATFSVTECWLEQNFGYLLLDEVHEQWELGLAQRIWTTLRPVDTTDLSHALSNGRSMFRQVREKARSFLVWLKSQDGVDESAVRRMEAGIAAYDPCHEGGCGFFLAVSFEDLRVFLEEHQRHNLSLMSS